MCSVHARQLRLYLLYFFYYYYFRHVYLRWQFRRTAIARTRRWVCNVHSTLVATLFIVRCTFDKANLECAQNFLILCDCYFRVVESSANVRCVCLTTVHLHQFTNVRNATTSSRLFFRPHSRYWTREKCAAHVLTPVQLQYQNWHQLLQHKYQCHLNKRIPFVAQLILIWKKKKRKQIGLLHTFSLSIAPNANNETFHNSTF